MLRRKRKRTSTCFASDLVLDTLYILSYSIKIKPNSCEISAEKSNSSVLASLHVYHLFLCYHGFNPKSPPGPVLFLSFPLKCGSGILRNPNCMFSLGNCYTTFKQPFLLFPFYFPSSLVVRKTYCTLLKLSIMVSC